MKIIYYDRWKCAEEVAATLAKTNFVRVERLPGAWNEDGYWEKRFAVVDLGPVPFEHPDGTYRGDVDPTWIDPNAF